MMDLFSLVMDLMMSLFSHVLWHLAFVFGTLIGLYFGCYFFIDPKPSRVDDFPLWLKYPDFDRVRPTLHLYTLLELAFTIDE